MSVTLELENFGALNEAGEIELEFAGTVIGGPPGPKGNDGEDGQDGLPGQDGIDGTDGKDGITPSFSIGTVGAVAPGQNPQITAEGVFPHYVLNFLVPRGINGRDGDDGPPGMPGTGTATVYRSPDTPSNSVGDDGDLWVKLKP